MYLFSAKYARYLPEKKRRESWDEMVNRVFDMHVTRYQPQISINHELQSEIEFAKLQVKKKRVLGAQRILQFGGEPIFKHNAKVFNCSFGYIDRPAAFSEAMYLLLCGCGVGFSVQYKHANKLPKTFALTKGTKVFEAEDSIEGWANCVKALIESYMVKKSEHFGFDIVFDLTKIRPEGALIAGQFKAPGPEGLRTSLRKARDVIENRLQNKDTVN